jgi:integrase
VRKSAILGHVRELTKTQARRCGTEYIFKNAINSPHTLMESIAPTVFRQAAELWLEMKVPSMKPSSRNSTRYSVNKHIVPKFGRMNLNQVNKFAAQRWINELVAGKKLAPKTIRNLVKLLKLILAWNEIPTSWRLALPEIPPLEQRWFTQKEVVLLVEAAAGQYKVLFRLAYATGARAGELFGLRVEDVDFKRGVVVIQRSTFRNEETSPKSKNGYRTIFLDAVTLQILRTHLAGRTTGRIFSTRLGSPLKDGDVCRSVLGPLCTRLGIPHGGMHAFRHGRVSRMFATGVPDGVILKEVGHSSLLVTNIYLHFEDAKRREYAETNALIDPSDPTFSTGQD